MKKVFNLSLISIIIYVFYSCITIDSFYAHRVKRHVSSDLSEYIIDDSIGCSCRAESTIFLYNKGDSILERHHRGYLIKIGTPRLPRIKLNHITFTREPNKDTIPIRVRYTLSDCSAKKYDTILMEHFPFIIEKGTISDEYYFDIIAERIVSMEEEEIEKNLHIKANRKQYYKTDKTYISFDIEVGSERFIRNNIEYKWYHVRDVRPELLNFLF